MKRPETGSKCQLQNVEERESADFVYAGLKQDHQPFIGDRRPQPCLVNSTLTFCWAIMPVKSNCEKQDRNFEIMG